MTQIGDPQDQQKNGFDITRTQKQKSGENLKSNRTEESLSKQEEVGSGLRNQSPIRRTAKSSKTKSSKEKKK